MFKVIAQWKYQIKNEIYSCYEKYCFWCPFNTQTEGTYVPRVSKQMANKQNRNILCMCQNLFLKFVLHPIADKMAS